MSRTSTVGTAVLQLALVIFVILTLLSGSVSAQGPTIFDLVKGVQAGQINSGNYYQYISDAAKLVATGRNATQYSYSTGSGGYSVTTADSWQMAVNESAPFVTGLTQFGVSLQNYYFNLWSAQMAGWGYNQAYGSGRWHRWN